MNKLLCFITMFLILVLNYQETPQLIYKEEFYVELKQRPTRKKKYKRRLRY